MNRATLVLLSVLGCPSIAAGQEIDASTRVTRIEERSTSVTVARAGQATDTERAAAPEEPPPASGPAPFLHGFRLGYLYTFDVDGPLDSRQPARGSYAEEYDVRSPHSFLFGYELAWRMVSHDWLNLLLIGNISIAGVEQSRLFPSANLLFGFEVDVPGIGDVQLGVGASFTPTRDEPVHMITAIGVAPRVGTFYIPLHFVFVPDVDGHHRLGITLGANFF